MQSDIKTIVMMNFAIWLILLLLPWIGLFLFKIVPKRLIRWISYLAFLAIFVISEITHVSFTLFPLNALFLLVILIGIGEFIWISTLLKKRIIKWVTPIIGIIFIYLFVFVTGLAALAGFHFYSTENLFDHKSLGNIDYFVTQKDPSGATAHWQEFALYVKFNHIPFKRRLDWYSTGQNGYRLGYAISWRSSEKRMIADLVSNGKIVKSLGTQ
jgi:hypothetical protein